MFLIKLSPKSYLSYNYIIHTQKKIMCVCVSILESTLFRLFVNLFLDRPISRENTVSAGAAHNHKRKNGGRGRRLFRWFFVPSPFSLENLSSVACFVTKGSWFLVNMELI